MGITGSVTSAVSSTSVTMPATGLTLVAVNCQKHTIGGYLTIVINQGADTALFPFSVGARGVTAVANVVAQPPLNNCGLWLVNTTLGLKLNYTGTGLTSGTFFFYYGSPFALAAADTYNIVSFAGVEQDVTTSVAAAFTFPGGTVQLTYIAYEPGFNAGETNFATDFTWNTASGRSIDQNFDRKDPLIRVPLTDISAAQSLTVTAAFDGTHVATGRLILYYTRPGIKA